MEPAETTELTGLPEGVSEDPVLNQKYRLERVLGSGGMGIVIAARHVELDEPVAIKFLLPKAALSRSAAKRFHREARATAKIKSEHVVRIIDVCVTSSSTPYIVMERLEGRGLDQVLCQLYRRQLPVDVAVDFVLQAGEALAEAHRLGIVHRDLKPANLFCVEEGGAYPVIKVLDFGVSKLLVAANDADKTSPNEILGSPRYMSPEQIGAPSLVDQRTDIWSIGVILYQCTTGRLPFDGSTSLEIWQQIGAVTPVPPQLLCPELPAGLGVVISRCLEKEPSRRFAGVDELAAALKPFAKPRSSVCIERILWAAGTASASTLRSTAVPVSTASPSVKGRASQPILATAATVGIVAVAALGASGAGLLHEPEVTGETSARRSPSQAPARERGLISPPAAVTASSAAPTRAGAPTGEAPTDVRPRTNNAPLSPARLSSPIDTAPGGAGSVRVRDDAAGHNVDGPTADWPIAVVSARKPSTSAPNTDSSHGGAPGLRGPIRRPNH